ncbi:hypothetical protein CLOSTASPAR_00640 [[Clostridium] asparagiforme DSM 15981]|uniref:Uncharacterized protein n=1 Tax=[Clostridium] asparagiforme DSM 15981 TaxID=518636 RepID=C0CUV2_9FIRM|nr:hypothetical protein CLOSTASPAR_00640 [[Clostridium] asparagiforme DSM 15981]
MAGRFGKNCRFRPIIHYISKRILFQRLQSGKMLENRRFEPENTPGCYGVSRPGRLLVRV